MLSGKMQLLFTERLLLIKMSTKLQALLQRLKKILVGGEVIVLGGGSSSEKNASFATSNRVLRSLQNLGIKSHLINPEIDKGVLLKKLKEAKIVFLGLHGGYGEDGTIQGWLDFYGIKYTGSGVLASAIGMNKIITKKLFVGNNIPTPEFVERANYSNIDKFIGKSEKSLKYPLFIKIANEGSGNGVFLIKSRNEFKQTLQDLEKNKDTNVIYAERFVKGRELSVCVFETEGEIIVFPILEAKFDAEFFNKEVRMKPNGYVNEVPARVSKLVKNQIRNIAILTYKSMFADSYLRLDIRLERSTNIPYVIEVTTLPGLTEKSWLPTMSQNYGYTFDELVVRTLLSAFEHKYGIKDKS